MASLRLPVLVACLVFGGALQAQVTYGGYDLGPDYGAMLQQMQQQQDQLQEQMRQQEMLVVQNAMANPDCAAKYRQHLAQGGQLSYEQFAWQYAATGGLTAIGIAQFQQNERANQQREHATWLGLRDAETQRAAAQQQYAEGYQRNLQHAGDNLQGRSAWIDPFDGQAHTLGYLEPDTGYYDAQSGRAYHRDATGQYHVQGSDGLWYPMTPAR